MVDLAGSNDRRKPSLSPRKGNNHSSSASAAFRQSDGDDLLRPESASLLSQQGRRPPTFDGVSVVVVSLLCSDYLNVNLVKVGNAELGEYAPGPARCKAQSSGFKIEEYFKDIFSPSTDTSSAKKGPKLKELFALKIFSQPQGQKIHILQFIKCTV